MSKKAPKPPTKKEMTQMIFNIDAGFRNLSQILKMYMEFKGDLIIFNQHLAKKQEELEQKAKETQDNTTTPPE